MRNFINKHCLVECDEGTGAVGERLFDSMSQCDGCYKLHHVDDLTEVETDRYDNDMLCPKCLEKKELLTTK